MRNAISLVALFMLSVCGATWAQDWKQAFEAELPLLGHRNWVAIVDSAYPLQTSPGIKMIATKRGQIEVVTQVLAALNEAAHVSPLVYTDAELEYVPNDLAEGIDEYRSELGKVLKGQNVQPLPHEEIIARLDEAGKTFRIFVIKTPLAIPYTSVFMRLDCGYWGPESEQKLRQIMSEHGK